MSDLPLNIDVQQILLHFFNFAILFVGLYLILYKPVKDFMDNRTAKYNKDKEEAENLLNSAAEKEKLYQEKLEATDKEIADKKRKADAEIDELRSTGVAQAKKEAESIVENARKEAFTLKENIIKSAEKDITEMVEQASRKMMLEESTEDVYDAFLKEAKRSVKDGKAGK